jgi:hypothetical protein
MSDRALVVAIQPKRVCVVHDGSEEVGSHHDRRPPGAARQEGARPAGQARVDWEVVQDIANRVGLGWNYTSAREIFDEIVAVMPSYTNLSYDNLGLTGKLYPNPDPEHSDGTVVMFGERFNTDEDWPTWCRPNGCSPRNCRMSSSRSCSILAGCWSTGTPAR